jgi:uncharacterized protein with PIN domain
LTNNKKLCPKCGNRLKKVIEPDEKPDGTILGYAILICTKCEYWRENDKV